MCSKQEVSRGDREPVAAQDVRVGDRIWLNDRVDEVLGVELVGEHIRLTLDRSVKGVAVKLDANPHFELSRLIPLEEASESNYTEPGVDGIPDDPGDTEDEVIDETDARAYVETSARGLIEDLAALQAVAGEEASYELINDRETLESLGVEVDPDGLVDCDSAIEALYALPLAVEVTTTFEVVLGVGGPSRSLCFECDRIRELPGRPNPDGGLDPFSYEIRRVFYRYSWDGSAEFELTGEDREVAEAFGRRVVPELGE